MTDHIIDQVESAPRLLKTITWHVLLVKQRTVCTARPRSPRIDLNPQTPKLLVVFDRPTKRDLLESLVNRAPPEQGQSSVFNPTGAFQILDVLFDEQLRDTLTVNLGIANPCDGVVDQRERLPR